MATVKEQQRLASTARMLEAAEKLFAREGYTRASLSRIADMSGMVKGSLSLRFGTKENLYNAVQNKLWQTVLTVTENQKTADSFLKALLHFLRSEEEQDSDHYHFIDAFIRGTDAPESAMEYAVRLFSGSHVEKMIRMCMQEGKLPKGPEAEIFTRLNRFALGTFGNYRTCGMNPPSDETILSGMLDKAVPQAGNSSNPDETLKDIGRKAMMTDYDILFYVEVRLNSEEDRIHLIRINPDFDDLCPCLKQEIYAYSFFRTLNEQLVLEEDRDMFQKTLFRKPVLKKLTLDGKMSFQFRIKDQGLIRHYQMSLYVDLARDGSLRGYTAGIKNSDENYRLTLQASNSRRIIEVLAKRYTSLYHVDAVTGRMTSYTTDQQINNAFHAKIDEETLYDDAIRNFAVRFSGEGQNLQTEEESRLDNVVAHLNREPSFERFFRYSDGWQNHYGRVHFTRTGLAGESLDGFVMALDLDDERVLRHYINKSLEDEYISIYFIDLEREIIRCYKQSEATSTGRFSSMPLDKVCKAFAKEVKPAYRQQFEAFGNPQNIVEFIGYEERREYTYELRGTVGTWRRSVWQIAEWNDGQPSGVLVTFMSLDDVNVRRMRLDNDISNTLSARYDNIFCVDLDEDRFLYSRLNEKAFAFLGKIPEQGMRFSEFTDLYISNFVHENDRERVTRTCSPEHLITAFRKNRNFNITYLSGFSGPNRYREMSFTQMPDEFGHIRFIWAFVDADDRVRYEMNRTAELQRKNIALNRISEDIIDLLGNLTEARDIQSGEHIRRVKGFTHILAYQVMSDWPEYGLTGEQIELMTSASALHDVGKIMIPDAILLKNAPLTSVERRIMETHCEKGCDILSKAPKDWSEDYVKMSMDICRYHHEKYDGNGYPHGLKGEEIPISAQIVSVADCFDALTSERVYKGAYATEDAYQMILNGECGVFSEKIMDSFKKCRDAYFHHAESISSHYSSSMPVGYSAGILSGMKYLYVADPDTGRNTGSGMINSEGAVTVSTPDGQEAVRIFAEAVPGSFNAVLIDTNISDTGALNTVKSLRKSGAPEANSIPIILLATEPAQKNMEEYINAGINTYLVKPLTIEDISETILAVSKKKDGA